MQFLFKTDQWFQEWSPTQYKMDVGSVYVVRQSFKINNHSEIKEQQNNKRYSILVTLLKFHETEWCLHFI